MLRDRNQNWAQRKPSAVLQLLLLSAIALCICLFQNCTSQVSLPQQNADVGLAALTITSVSPAGGPLTGGNSITVTGTGFNDASRVTVGGQACAVTNVTTTQITCTVPSVNSYSWSDVVVYAFQSAARAPLAYGYGAVAVGQPSLIARSELLGGSLSQPAGMTVLGSQLYVADSLSNRIVAYSAPVLTGTQAPNFVLGNADLNAGMIADSDPNASALNMATPSGVCSDGTRLMYVDSAYNRVVIYNQAPAAGNTVPDIVLGQSDFTGLNANQGQTTPTANTLFAPDSIYCDPFRVIVSDSGNNRILIWTTPITASGQSADLVLGQPNFMTAQNNQGGGPSANSLSRPHGIAFDGTNFYVADSGNHRVLVWTSLPSVMDQAANIALGPNSLNSSNGGGCTASGFDSPKGLAVISGFLYVADSNLSRVMVWNVANGLSTGEAAAGIIGQNSNQVCQANQGNQASLLSLRNPTQIASSGADLYISDSGNNRVLYFATAPALSGSPATDAIGQLDSVSTSLAYPTLSPYSFKSVQHGLISAGNLFVTDSQQNRVLVYTPVPTLSGTSANNVLGQPDLFTGITNTQDAILSSQTLAAPTGVFVDSNQNVYISDSGNNRTLLFNSMSSVLAIVDTAANFVFGQNSFSNGQANLSATGSNAPYPGCWSSVADGNQYFLPDSNNNRVLVFNNFNPAAPSNANQPSFVIGQPDFVSNNPNIGLTNSNTLFDPGYISCDGVGHLMVADTYDSRVLIFNLPVTGNMPNASLSLGQADMFSSQPNQGQGLPGSSTMAYPMSAVATLGKLYVADTQNNRILVWNSFPTYTGQPADAVFGQTDFVSNYRNAGSTIPNANLLAGPASITTNGPLLVVADQGNNRLLIIPAP